MFRLTKSKYKLKSKPKSRLGNVSPGVLLFVKQVFTGLLIFGTVGLIIIGIWYCTRFDSFTISEITASGGATISPVLIKQLAEKQLEGTYFGLIPKRFAYFYPKGEILSVVGGVERIKNVQIELLNHKSLSINYGEYSPNALWCKEKGVDECLFIDETGYAFGQAPDLDGGSLLRFYTLQDSPTKSKFMVQTEEYLAILELVTRLAESGWFVHSVEIDLARDIFFTLEGGGELKVTLKENVDKTLGYLNTVRESEKFKHLAPGNFQYIDLRFGTKIFVNEMLEQKIETVIGSTSSQLIPVGEIMMGSSTQQ